MLLEARKSTLKGAIFVAGSKSHTLRGIIAATLAKGTSTLIDPLDTEDISNVLNLVEKLGVKVEKKDNLWKITGTGGVLKNPQNILKLADCETSLVMLSLIASLQNFPVTFNENSLLSNLNIPQLLDSLSSLGVKCSKNNVFFTIQGPLKGGNAKVYGKTSQILNALLFSCPLAKSDTILDLDYLNEQPEIGITVDWLEFLGIKYKGTRDLLHWEIPGKQNIKAFNKIIPADFSIAIYPLVAATLAGYGVNIGNLDFSDVQGDKRVFSMLERMGALIKWNDTLDIPLKVEPSTKLTEVTLDINTTPNALPILAIACLFLPGVSKLINVPQARLQEIDYISLMAKELTKIGAKVEELPDGLIIWGKQKLHSARIDSHFDYRIAMAFAIVALAMEETEVIEIEHAECIEPYYPHFIEDFKALGANFRILE